MCSSDPDLRAQLDELSLADLQEKLRNVDPATTVDLKNRRRVVRAIEISVLSGRPASEQRGEWKSAEAALSGGAANLPASGGVFVFRDRDDLHQRINRRVARMFDSGVIEEARGSGPVSETASKMIGFREIRDLIDGKFSAAECIAAIQRGTRRYAKRQLTWFRRQTSFQPLNLSVLSHVEAVKRISQFAKTFGTAQAK